MVNRTKHLTRHERMKAESARQVGESVRENEVSTLSATIQARDSEIAVLKEEIYEIVKAGEVSKNCINTLHITVKELVKIRSQAQKRIKKNFLDHTLILKTTRLNWKKRKPGI